ncbi:MAG TPA: class I SAM-dependent methyltransferase [Candidatus Acidoferrum sp.]|jgi:ubiquinone/menaquinone biosynthesis C-methylase UbiE|nr:class I SAM-dependent methyltransferase [Candidatus Acidoferrum sp.]
MAHSHDVDRFNRWASDYDRHWMQRVIFEPVQRTVLKLAAEQVPHPAAILDVGCGTGRLLGLAQGRFPGARLDGVDAAIEMVRQAQTTSPGSAIQFQQGVAEELPFPERSFDLVFSTMTFHHWSDQGRGIAEIARVLKPDGRWLLAEFVASGFVGLIRRVLRLHQFPERADLGRRLLASGLQVMAEERVQGLHGQVVVMAIGPRA